jgi:hypothetical protein
VVARGGRGLGCLVDCLVGGGEGGDFY